MECERLSLGDLERIVRDLLWQCQDRCVPGSTVTLKSYLQSPILGPIDLNVEVPSNLKWTTVGNTTGDMFYNRQCRDKYDALTTHTLTHYHCGSLSHFIDVDKLLFSILNISQRLCKSIEKGIALTFQQRITGATAMYLPDKQLKIEQDVIPLQNALVLRLTFDVCIGYKVK